MLARSFWQHLATQPIIGLSPMDGITDQPFRFITKKYGQPDVVFTEFTSVEGLGHGATQLLRDFVYDETQRPIVAQIYGTTPAFFEQAAVILCTLGFDGIDINMGCPAKNVAHSGAGAALIKTPELAQAIIRATHKGVLDWQNGRTVADCPDITTKIATEVEQRATQLPAHYQDRSRIVPVSVKTRVGFDQPVIAEWIPRLLETEPAVISLHGRTLRQGYAGEASWAAIGQAAELVRPTSTLILGNGDVRSREDALARVQQFGVNGVLIGRASFGNPYVFRPRDFAPSTSIYAIALEHARLFEATYGSSERFHFAPMRKHLGWYVRNFANAKQVRIELFQSNSATQVEEIFAKHQLLETQSNAIIDQPNAVA